MKHIIYSAKNIETGSEYIGMTNRTVSARRKEHKNDALGKRGFCRAFHAAIRKYGIDAFEWSVIGEADSREEASRMEIEAIAARNPRYNITKGGAGIIMPRTPEWIEKIARANRGRKLSAQAIANIKAARPAGLGKKPVVCLEDRAIFASVGEAAKHYGVGPISIGLTANGKQHTCVGKHFVFSASVPVDCDAEIQRIKRSKKVRSDKKPGPRTKCGVLSVRKTNEELEAGRASRIAKLKARRHSPETIERMRAAAKKRGIAQITRDRHREVVTKPVRCVETGTIFQDARLAGLAHGLAEQPVYALIYKGGKSRIAGVSFERV